MVPLGNPRHEDSKKATVRCPKTGPPLARAPAPTVRAPKLTINCRLVKLPGLRATIEVRLVYYKTIAQPLAGAVRTARPFRTTLEKYTNELLFPVITFNFKP